MKKNFFKLNFNEKFVKPNSNEFFFSVFYIFHIYFQYIIMSSLIENISPRIVLEEIFKSFLDLASQDIDFSNDEVIFLFFFNIFFEIKN